MLALFLKSCTEPMVIKLVEINDENVKLIDEIVDENIVNGRSSTTLLLGINQLMDRNNVGYQDVQCIYMASGPGSYTGARILLAIVKTMKILYKNLQVYDISLVTLYEQTAYENNENNYLGVVFARRNKYYLSGTLSNKRIEPNVLSTDELMELLKQKVCINGFDYSDEHELTYYVEQPLDITIWFNNAFYVEDMTEYEPYYLEEVKIG